MSVSKVFPSTMLLVIVYRGTVCSKVYLAVLCQLAGPFTS